MEDNEQTTDKVTIYQSLYHAKEQSANHVPIELIFSRIKSNKHKDLIKRCHAAAAADDKELLTELKKKLPLVCFSGIFKKRTDEAILEHSGFIVGDMDKYPTAAEMRKERAEIEAKDYVLACFATPSGKGFKFVARIPKCNSQEHRLFFAAIKHDINSLYWDDSCVNPSRGHFESHDPNLYHNPDALVWDVIEDSEPIPIDDSGIHLRVVDTSEKLRRALVWFEKRYSMAEADNARNVNLYKLAMYTNDLGIPQSEVVNYAVNNWANTTFKESEVIGVIDNAYSNTGNWNTKGLKDDKLEKSIKRDLRLGESKKSIRKKMEVSGRYGGLDLEQAIDECEKNLDDLVFWRKRDNGSVIIVAHEFKDYLESLGFCRHYMENAEVYNYIFKENNIVEIVSISRIKDAVLSRLIKLDDMSIYDHMASNPKYFKDDYLSLLECIEIPFVFDDRETCYLYYSNYMIEITSHKVTKIDYLDMNGYVWRSHLINREYVTTASEENDFKYVVKKITGEDKAKQKSLESVAGYLLHSFKNKAQNKAIIFNDEIISSDPNGGTGKGLFMQAIGHIKRIVRFDGQNLKFDKSFLFQTVTPETQILILEDIDQKFHFNKLFSIITEGMTIEKKNKDAVVLPVSRSPKIAITTNYALKAQGGSVERRKFEVEFSQYYSDKFSPEDDLGHLLFDDWDDEHWARFDKYMVRCIQTFLEHGLIPFEFTNLPEKQFRRATCDDFLDWADFGAADGRSMLPLNVDIDRKKKYQDFIEEFGQQYKWLQPNMFTKWIKRYGEYKGYEVQEIRIDSTARGFLFTDPTDGEKPKPKAKTEVDEFLGIDDDYKDSQPF